MKMLGLSLVVTLVSLVLLPLSYFVGGVKLFALAWATVPAIVWVGIAFNQNREL